MNLLETSEQKRLITLFSSLGVNKLRFTGGEPTINRDICELIQHGRSIPNMGMIGITTNGVKLGSQLNKLVDAGLSSVNISLDTLDPEKFAFITRRTSKHFHRVLSSIYAAIAQGLKVKVNVVIMRDFNYEEIPQFVKVMHESSMEGEDIDVVFVSLDFAKDVESRLIPFAKKNGIFENVVILDDPRENEWIPKVDKDWSGAIPATVIYKGKHRRFYEKPFVYKELKKEIEYFKEL